MNLLLLLFFTVYCSAFSFSADDKISVHGRVFYANEHCVGDAGMHDNRIYIDIPVPLADLELRVVEGSTHRPDKPAKVIHTDQLGQFEIALSPGKYCLAIADKAIGIDDLHPGGIYSIDSACYQDWRQSCDLSFEVASAPVRLPDLVLHKTCNVNSFSPCLKAIGLPRKTSSVSDTPENYSVFKTG